MRRRLLAGVTAAVVAITLGVFGPARPANAVVPYAQIAIAVAQYLFSRGGGISAADLERAKREIIDAINASRPEIIGQIDTIASAEVRACTDAATTKMIIIDQMDPFTLALFTNDAVNCATLSSAYFDAVQTKSAADTIGRLLGTIYSIAMVGYAKVGFPTADLLDRLIRSYDAVVVKLAPDCCVVRTYSNPSPDGGAPLDQTIYYTYTAYNGDTGTTYAYYFHGQLKVAPDHTGASNEATRNTSRATAQQALPTLRSLQAG